MPYNLKNKMILYADFTITISALLKVSKYICLLLSGMNKTLDAEMVN